MQSYEECRRNLEALASWYSAQSGQRNEATTRLHLIDRLFLDCLGWSIDDVVAEESHGGEYADYTFRLSRRVLIVEAKKEGNYFELPAGTDRLELPIRTLLHDYPNLKVALEQASGYCQGRGVTLGAVCNGHQLVAFVATRVDGLSPLDGKALVFSSLDFMLGHFLDLWQAVSRPGVQDQRLQQRLLGDVRLAPPEKLSARIPQYPGIRNRNVFQTDLQLVSDLILEDVTRSPELEKRFLEDCYCQSGALSQYALTSRTLLQARYAALFDSRSPGPAMVPAVDKDGVSAELLAESFSKRPILLIGDVGVGKTSFVRHLIHVDAAPLFENAITLYIDLGSQATLVNDIKGFVLDEITRQLLRDYEVDIEERNFVRGVYHGELKRFRSGIYSDLRETNADLFREREIDFLAHKLNSQEQHLRAVLTHLTKGHRKQVVVFLDNADQRSDDTQQQAFLIAQELAEHWPATVFLSLRPETFHRSLKGGTLSGYHPKAFTISPPRIDLVLQKRLEFALKLTSGEIPIRSLEATRVRLTSLDAIIRVFLESLQQRRELIEFIENVSAGNVRRALDQVKGFFGSGHVDTQKIVNIYQETGAYTVPLHEFLRAVMFGDSDYYDPDRSPIANLFDVSSADPKEHFLLPSLIEFLAVTTNPGMEEGFVDTTRVYEQFQGLGFTPEQVDSAVIRAHRYGLIETGARRVPEIGHVMPYALRATTVGIYHVKRLCHLFAFLDAIIVDTPIFDQKTQQSIHDAQNLSERLQRAETFRRYLTTQWSGSLTSNSSFDWTDAANDLEADIERARVSQQRRQERLAP